MQEDLFYQLGKKLYQYRWWTITLWMILLLAALPFASKLTEPFKDIGFIDQTSESATANELLNKTFGFNYNQFMVMYHSDILFATDAKFQRQIQKSLEEFNDFPIRHQITYPTLDNKQISADQHTAYVTILFEGEQGSNPNLLSAFKAALNEPMDLEMRIGGEPIFLDETRSQTQTDLFKSEFIATPVAIITMLIVFGTVVAASIPIVLGGVGAFFILVTLFFLGHYFSLSVFTINIALLLGICLSLDYALLIVNRFKDELAREPNIEKALAVTQATAGKAVFFSGLAVLISLSALLLFKINVLFSVGMGGLASVSVSVLIAIILLPAVLAVLHHNINRWALPFYHAFSKQNPLCRWLITKVTRTPYRYFFVILIILLMMGYPFLKVKYGISDFRILPKNLESRQVFDVFSKEFGESRLSPIIAVVQTSKENILNPKNIDVLYDFAKKLENDSRIEQVTGIVSLTPELTKKDYLAIYDQPIQDLDPRLQQFLKYTTKKDLTFFSVVSKNDNHAPETINLVKMLRATKLNNHLTLAITGNTANTLDVLKSIGQTFPYAFLWIIGFTYLILLVFLRSILLPIKAILTTMLSLFASYGILVLVVQQGFLHELLNFDPQGILDISLLIIIFCALFGISMDYEVFLLTRIKEYYEKTKDTNLSIVNGIDRSWKIITSAAIIVILICFSFMAADILIVKAFGLGIAVAVFVDAYIIRTLLVPATMAILGKWNWYLPLWLDKILPKVSFDPEHT